MWSSYMGKYPLIEVWPLKVGINQSFPLAYSGCGRLPGKVRLLAVEINSHLEGWQQ